MPLFPMQKRMGHFLKKKHMLHLIGVSKKNTRNRKRRGLIAFRCLGLRVFFGVPAFLGVAKGSICPGPAVSDSWGGVGQGVVERRPSVTGRLGLNRLNCGVSPADVWRGRKFSQVVGNFQTGCCCKWGRDLGGPPNWHQPAWGQYLFTFLPANTRPERGGPTLVCFARYRCW